MFDHGQLTTHRSVQSTGRQSGGGVQHLAAMDVVSDRRRRRPPAIYGLPRCSTLAGVPSSRKSGRTIQRRHEVVKKS